MRESHDEKMAGEALAMQSSPGGVKKSMLGVSDTLPQGMKTPAAPGEMHMGGVRKGDSAGGNDSHLGNSNLKSAMAQLNYETERNEHAPDVAGCAGTGAAHHGIMKKA